MRLILLAWQLTVAQGVSRLPAPARSDSTIRAAVDSATREFLTKWRYAWQESQHEQPLPSGEAVRDADLRTLALHCHWIATPPRVRQRVITGELRAQAACPNWYPIDAPPIEDERLRTDAALSAVGKAIIGPLRQSLRFFLDSAARQLPGDASIAGQRVRFAIDANDAAGARTAASSCTSDAVRCGLLRGLVLYRTGRIASADSAFAAAADRMTDTARCTWNDVRVLLESDMRHDYAALSCAERATFNDRLWLLADPLYLEPGNERRAEHVARKVVALLLAPLGFDGRQHWSAKQGGDAVTETLIRYGWPTQMYWGGPRADAGHDGWLVAQGVDTAPPYVVREYSRDRLHTVPNSAALRSPFHATNDDWRLNAPGDDDTWWPIEHYARDASHLGSLPIGQRVMLRRDAATRFLWAGDLRADTLGRAAGTAVSASMFASRTLADLTRVASAAGRVGEPVVLDALLSPGDALIGVELPGDALRPAARTRFGITVPAPLRALAGATALSEPLLFEPPSDDRLSIDADAAVRRMLGSTTLPRTGKIGVYWEAYGMPTGDDAEIEVRMDREDRPGVLSRVGGLFGLGGGTTGSLAIRWRETRGSSRAIQRVEGTVPVEMRSIILDVSRLAPGTYRLHLSSTRAGAPAVTSDRALVLR